MRIRNFSPFFIISEAVKKAANIFSVRNSSLFRGLTVVITAFLLIVKVAAPFLHTHNSVESSKQEISASFHCDACEYEATQAIQPDPAIQLPVTDFQSELKVFETQSPFISESHLPSESRGPPKNS
jgi:hypothetical protein